MRVLHVTEYRHTLNKNYCLIQYYVAKIGKHFSCMTTKDLHSRKNWIRVWTFPIHVDIVYIHWRYRITSLFTTLKYNENRRCIYLFKAFLIGFQCFSKWMQMQMTYILCVVLACLKRLATSKRSFYSFILAFKEVFEFLRNNLWFAYL